MSFSRVLLSLIIPRNKTFAFMGWDSSFGTLPSASAISMARMSRRGFFRSISFQRLISFFFNIWESSETIFLSKMTRKNFLTQLRQVDNGDNSARMHEIINQTVGQIRENSKFSSTQRTELEKFYKEIRKDLGLDELSDVGSIQQETEQEKEDSTILDSRGLNAMIDKYLKSK